MRKEVYECDRCKVQVDIPRLDATGAPPKVDSYASGWRSMQLGPIGTGPACIAGTYCPACVADIETVMARADADVLVPATDEDLRNAFKTEDERP